MTNLDPDSMDDDFLSFCWSSLSPRDRAKVMAGSSRTLWLFGAGASHHYNLNSRGVSVPLANDFFEAFSALPTSEGYHAHVGPFISYLAHYRGVPPVGVHKWRENIETFMTSIEEGLADLRSKLAERPPNAHEWSKGLSLAMVFNNMSFILANVINEAQNGPSESLYRMLLNYCGPNDAFVTFNWDTLLDRALAATGGWSPNDGYGLSFTSVLDGNWKPTIEGGRTFSTNWKVLKLHGSTNWLVPYTSVHLQTFEYVSSVPESTDIFLYWQSSLPYATWKSRWKGGYSPTCYCYYPPNLPSSCFRQEHLSPAPGHVFVSVAYKGIFSPFDEPGEKGVPSSALLITPVRQKKYEMYQSTVNELWRQTADLFEDADRIVIVGYSFPTTDTRALDLLTSALAARRGKIELEIVAPDADAIAARIGDDALSGAKSVAVRKARFEEYIRELSKLGPSLVKKAAGEHKEVLEWMQRTYALNKVAGAEKDFEIEPE
jgi:hypothetical protein